MVKYAARILNVNLYVNPMHFGACAMYLPFCKFLTQRASLFINETNEGQTTISACGL
jgi:hypothetical protein